MRAGAALVAVGVVCLALSACAGTGTGKSYTSLEDLLAQSSSSSDAPRAFSKRTPLEPCGPFESSQAEAPEELFDCLNSAASNGTEAVLVSYTVEGDPLVRYYRWVPGGEHVEVFTDGSFDNYGGSWSLSVCPPPEKLEHLEACEHQMTY